MTEQHGCRSAAPEPPRSSRMGRNPHAHRSTACGIARLSSLIVVAVAAQLCLAPIVAGQQPATHEGAPAASQIHRIAIVLARETRNVPPPLSLLDMPPPDDGVVGARLAIDDNNTTGRFLKQEFTLDVVQRSEEHTSELQPRFGISYAVFCLKQKTSLANLRRRPHPPGQVHLHAVCPTA